nr:glycosyltransferase [Bacteroidota bacterium]
MSLNKTIHILFLASWYPNRNHKSHGIFIKRQAEAAALFNQISTLHVCSDEKIKGNYQIISNEENGVKSVVAYYKKVNSNIPFLSNFIKSFRYIRAHFIGYNFIKRNSGKPDIIHLNVVQKAGLGAIFLQLRYKIPLIISEHWSGYMPEDGSYKGFYQKLITKTLFRKARAVIVLSEKMKNGIMAHGLKGDYHIIPNAVNHQVFKLKEKNQTTGKKKLVHIS